MHRAIFVCSGNICRSPMAEKIFASELKKRGLKGASISMGTLGLQGRSASRNSVIACEEIGVDLSHHSSQGLGAGLLHHATQIFVMERQRRAAITALDPALGARVVLMGTLDPEGGGDEIDDPIGMAIEDYRVCRDRLKRAIDRFLDERARDDAAS